MAIELLQAKPETSFFEQHHQTLRQLGDIVGLPKTFTSSLQTAVELTQPWVKGDHTRPDAAVALSSDQSSELRPVFADLNLKRASVLPAGSYDHIIVPGAVQLGNNGRIKFVKEAVELGEITTGDIVLLGGQRPVFGEVEAHLLTEDLRSIHEQGITDDWIKALDNQTERLIWETDFMRLAAIKHLGSLPLQQLHLRVIEDDSQPPFDVIKQYEFSWHDMPLRLLHTLATKRPNGVARPTTESCVKEWIEVAEPVLSAVVAFISSNPHRDRMAKSCKRALASVGRDDIELVVAGPASVESLGDHVFLGEVARNLYEASLAR